MEAAFEEWFEAHRTASWARTLLASEQGRQMPMEWGMGFRSLFHQAWMGAVLWCRTVPA